MCGISGLIRFNSNVQMSEIVSMTDSIAHRGPDGEGFHIEGNTGLGHRRLSIIDLDGGKQPMSDESKKIWITFNGEIYNYKDLRKQFISEGVHFHAHSDTEVIIYAYKKWGRKCVNYLRGMFAFCISDYNKQEFFLARDPFGIKPLVYTKTKEYFAFGSEIKVLNEVNGSRQKLKLESLDFFLRYQYIPGSDSIYSDVHKLQPGHYITVSFKGEITNPTRYWEFKFSPQLNYNHKELKEEAKEIINDSVKSHLVSDVPFGVFLSGGIDSTLIASQMKKLVNTPMKAFTIGFNEEDYSELKYAQKAAKTIGFDLEFDILTKDHYKDLEKILNFYDEPYGDFSAIPTYYVSQLARKHVPMVLSGDGADELFGGYGRYIGWGINTPFNRLKHDVKHLNFVSSITKFFDYGTNKIKYGDYRSLNDWWEYIYFTDDQTRHSLWKSQHKHLTKLKNKTFQETRKRGAKLNYMEFAQHIDINTYLCDDILTKVDIATMSNGLEARPPFLDKKMADFAMKIPTQAKFSNNLSVGKYILKDLLSEQFSNEFVNRKKMGFGIPKDLWFCEGGFLRNILMDYLHDDNLAFDLFDRQTMLTILKQHTMKNDLSNELWLILVLLIWFKNNEDISL